MSGFIIHNKKFEVGNQIDTFEVVAPLPFLGGRPTFGKEVVDLPRIVWERNCICFGFRGLVFSIPLDTFEPYGLVELREWCVEDFDDAEIDWLAGAVVFTYTTTHPLPDAC